MAISNISIRCLSENTSCRRVSTPRSLWTLKRTLGHPISNQISPFWSFYGHPFYIHLICPRVYYTTLALRALGGGGVSFSKTQFLDLLTTLNKLVISKFSLDVCGKMVCVGEELVALQSFLTIINGSSHFIVQTNELFSNFLRQQTAISKFLLDAFLENTRSVWGISTLLSPWISKRVLKLLIINPMSPILILYDHPFYINLIYPQGIADNPCPKGYGLVGGVILKDKFSGPFNYVETKWLSQNFDWKRL